jgi:DNA-binding NarL/FixJ family response regulator
MTDQTGFRILLADDHELLRDTLLFYIRSQSDMSVKTASNLDEARRIWLEERTFDLVLLDLRMPGMNGLSGLEAALSDGVRVAIISGVATRSVVEEAMQLGAAGFLSKTTPARALIQAINFMAMGETYVSPEFLGDRKADSGHPLANRLSNREFQVLERICNGLSDKEIARDLELQVPTVKLHAKMLFRKLNVSSRTQAAVIAKNEGLF